MRWCLLAGEGLIVTCVFFKQKAAYEMRISDWSSDVCSSDLVVPVTSLLSREDILAAAPNAITFEKHPGIRQKLTDLFSLGTFGENNDKLAKIGRASCRERACQYV